MNCHHIQKRLSAYQDGEIAGKEREQIAAHLEGCPACRSAYAELGQAWQLLEKIPEIEVSPGFERRLSARINAIPEPRSWWRLSWASWVYQAYPAPVMALALMLVGLVLGGYLGNVLVSGSRSVTDRTVYSQNSTDVLSFKVFAAVPPGTLGDGYLRMASFTEEVRK
jgi:anti-sigma factor RsiW